MGRLRQAIEDFARSVSDPTGFFSSSILTALDNINYPYKQVAAVYACVRAIGFNISSVPFYIVTADDESRSRLTFMRDRFRVENGNVRVQDLLRDEGYKVVESGALVDLFTKPNPNLSGSTQYWELVVQLMMLYGEATNICEGRDNPAMVPKELWPEKPDLFKPKYVNRVPATWKYTGLDGRPTTYPNYQLIRPRLIDPQDPVRGCAPYKAAEKDANLDWKAIQYNEAFYENDGTPSFILTTTPNTPKQKLEDKEEEMEQRHKGARKAHRFAIMRGITGVHQMSLPPKEIQQLTQRKLSREQIAMVYGVPKTVLTVYEDVNFATARSSDKGFWTKTLIPIIRAIEEMYWADLFRLVEGGKYWGIFDLSQVEALQETLEDQLKAAKILYDLTYPPRAINTRLNLGMPENTWDEERLVPSGVVPASLIVSGGYDPKTQKSDRETEDEDEESQGVQLYRISKLDRKKEQVRWDRFKLQYEKDFYSKYRRWLFEVRKDQLAIIEKSYKPRRQLEEQLLFAQQEWNRRLLELTHPVYVDTMQGAGEYSAKLIGSPGFDMTDPAMIESLRKKEVKLVGVSNTLRNNLKTTIADGIVNNVGVSDMQQRVRTVFNFTEARALTVARTEVGQTAGMTRFNGFRQEGVELHSWQTAGAAARPRPRHTHLDAEDMGSIKMGEVFGATGCLYPLDPAGPPNEIINCRCCEIPEGKRMVVKPAPQLQAYKVGAWNVNVTKWKKYEPMGKAERVKVFKNVANQRKALIKQRGLPEELVNHLSSKQVIQLWAKPQTIQSVLDDVAKKLGTFKKVPSRNIGSKAVTKKVDDFTDKNKKSLWKKTTVADGYTDEVKVYYDDMGKNFAATVNKSTKKTYYLTHKPPPRNTSLLGSYDPKNMNVEAYKTLELIKGSAARRRHVFFHEYGHAYSRQAGNFMQIKWAETPAGMDLVKSVKLASGRNRELTKALKDAWEAQDKAVYNYMTKVKKKKPEIGWEWYDTAGAGKKYPILSPYSTIDPAEYFSEAVGDYVTGGVQLRKSSAGRRLYKEIRKTMFDGKEFK